MSDTNPSRTISSNSTTVMFTILSCTNNKGALLGGQRVCQTFPFKRKACPGLEGNFSALFLCAETCHKWTVCVMQQMIDFVLFDLM